MFMLSWKFTFLALGMMIGKYLLMLCFREAANKREEEMQLQEKDLKAITLRSFKANADIDHLVDSFLTKKEEIEKKKKVEKAVEDNEKFWAELEESQDPNDNLTAFSDYL